MDIPIILLGLAMICVGILIVMYQLKWFKKGLKDQFGYQVRFLMSGIGLILGGIIILVKNL